MSAITNESDVPKSYLEVVKQERGPNHSRGALAFWEEDYRRQKLASKWPNESLTPSKYEYVDVFLASWNSDDLQVYLELDPLQKLLEDHYNFDVTRYKIPDEDSEDELDAAIRRFRKGKSLRHLLVFYYAGHAGGSPSNCIFQANKGSNSPKLNFTSVQGSLLGHPSDLVIFLDCCFATIAANHQGVGNKWFLGAAPKESPAEGVSRDSFTSALTRALEYGAQSYWSKNQRFSLQSVYQSLIIWDREVMFTPTYVPLSEHECRAIEFTPLLEKRPKPLSRSSTVPSNGRPIQSTAGSSKHDLAPPHTSANGTSIPAYPANGNGGGSQDNRASETPKENVYAKLRRYDTVFLVDDSGSMKDYWKLTARVLGEIANIAIEYDGDGVDVEFFNANVDRKQRVNLNSLSAVTDLFDLVKPDGGTPTADRLDDVLSDYMRRYGEDREIKSLNLVILTDGKPEEGQNVEGVIVEYARWLAMLGAQKLKIGLQFVQIGSDKGATAFLDSLDNKLKENHGLDRDMVDTVKWRDGDQEFLHEKILLGGILKRFDNID